MPRLSQTHLKKQKSFQARRFFRPSLEQLEERDAPAVDLHPIRVRGHDFMLIEWEPQGGALTTYKLYRSDNPNAIFQGAGTQYLDRGSHLVQGTTYTYTITSSIDAALSTGRSAKLSPDATSNTEITGRVGDAGDKKVSIRRINPAGGSVAIDPTKETWISIHGRVSDATEPVYMLSTANAIRQARPATEQSLIIDWRNAAFSPGLSADGEYYIRDVALWAQISLSIAGFSPAQINLVGHSWGSYVAAEMASDFDHAPIYATQSSNYSMIPTGKVRSLVALDAAKNVWTYSGYDPNDHTNFSAHSRWSWAFRDGYDGIPDPIVFKRGLGSTVTSQTAHESFVVEGTDHGGIRLVFENLILDAGTSATNASIALFFTLDELRNNLSMKFWLKNRFDPFGSATVPLSERSFEAVIDTENLHATCVHFYTPADTAAPNQGCPIDGIVSSDLEASGSSSGVPRPSVTGTNALSVSNEVTNFSLSASTATKGTYYASRNPEQFGAEFVLGQRTIPALAPFNRSTNSTSLSLAGLPPQAFAGGKLYLAMGINSKGTPAARDLDWIEVPVSAASGDPDLTGVRFDVDPLAPTYTWGQTITVDYRLVNQGSAAAGPFVAGVYLSKDAIFDSNDIRLYGDSFVGAAAGANLGAAKTITLPASAPAGWVDGPGSLLLVIDDAKSVAESDEFNNFGRGSGVDLRSFIVGGYPSPSGDPIVSTMNGAPANAALGEIITIYGTAFDDGFVNDVELRLDTNGNGVFESTDRFLASADRLIGSYSARVATTGAGWVQGANVVLARAKDTQGHVSLTKSLTVTLAGLGAFTEDPFENNDTIATATPLNGTSINLSGLALGANDPDFYSFVNAVGSMNLSLEINFKQLAPAYGQPRGDLDLRLYLPNGSTLSKESFSSSSSNGRESIQVAIGAGRFYIQVVGAFVGGSTVADQNPNYSLSLSMARPLAVPVAAGLTASASSLVIGDPLTLSVERVTYPPGRHFDGVHMFRDDNQNGLLDDGERIAGPGATNTLPDGTVVSQIDTSGWLAGAYTVYAYVADNVSQSIPVFTLVQVRENQPPVVASISYPSTAIRGTQANITAYGVTDDEAVARVEVFQDVNDNGKYDAGLDLYLAKCIDGAAGTWSATVDTAGLPLGGVPLLVIPTDKRGASGAVVAGRVQITARVNQAPVIGSVSGPPLIESGNVYRLQVDGVFDDGGGVTCTAFRDVNGNGVWDAGDLPLSAGALSGGSIAFTDNTASWPLGAATIFIIATDKAVPPLTTQDSVEVRVLPAPSLALVTDRSSAPEYAGVGAATLTVIRTALDQSQPLTVTLNSSDAGELTVPASAVIAANSDRVTVVLTTIDDVLVDGTQSVTITAQAPGLTSATAPFDVADNDVAALALTVLVSPNSVGEGQSAAVVVTRADADLSADLNVALSYSLSNEIVAPFIVTIPAGQSSATTTFSVIDDATVENVQTMYVFAFAPGHDPGVGSVTITDNDLVLRSLALTYFANFTEGESRLFEVFRTGSTASALTVAVSCSDPGRLSAPQFVTIPAGATSSQFAVFAANDFVVQGSEMVSLSFSAPGFYDTVVGVTIADDDFVAPRLSLEIFYNQVYEGEIAAARIDRTFVDLNQPLSVQVGTTNNGELIAPVIVTFEAGQSSAYFLLQARDDAIYSGDRTAAVTVSASGFSPVSRSIFVLENDPAPRLLVWVTPGEIRENGGTYAGLLRVDRVFADTSLDLRVDLQLSGPPDIRFDSPSIVIPAGSSCAFATISAINNGRRDGNRLVGITATAQGALTSGHTDVLVVDDDAVSRLALAAGASGESHVRVSTAGK